MRELKVTPYEIILVGKEGKDADGKAVVTAVRRSKPGEKAALAGFKTQKYYQCRLRPVLENPMHLTGPPKVQTENFFSKTHSNFYGALEAIDKGGNLRQVEGTNTFVGKEEPIVIPGTIIKEEAGFEYKLQEVDATTRLRRDLKSKRWNPDKGMFEESIATASTVTLFIPEDQESSVDALIADAIKAVRPYRVKSKVTIEDDGQNRTEKVENEGNPNPEDQENVETEQ